MSAGTALLMALCAALLAGIVFVQVAVLQENMRRGRLNDMRAEYVAQTQDLQARIDQQTSEQAIAAIAARHGMLRPPASSVEQLAGG